MNGVAENFALFRFILSFGLVIGGIAAIWCGYRLFADGVGTARAVDKFDFKSTEVRLSTAGMSVGAVLMLTSGFWSFFAYSSFPKLEASASTIKIGNLNLPLSGDGIQLTKVIGTPVYAKDKEKLGTISHVLVNGKAQAIGVVVQTSDGPSSRKVVLDPNALRFEKMGSSLDAVVKMGKSQFDQVPDMAYTPQPR
jgi:hypothetical protein